MSRTLCRVALFVLLVGGGCSTERPDAATSEQEVRAAVKSFVDTYNQHDAQKVAQAWATQGTYEHRESGQRLVGRDEIQKAFESAFETNKNDSIEASIDGIRFITPSVALVDGHSTSLQPGEAPSTTSFSLVISKHNKQWLLESVREVDLPTTTTNYEHLKELEWMVGDWEDNAEGVSIQTSCKWTANRSFLTRSYKVTRDDLVALEGTQVIGWDPTTKEIRSWLFDSDGGFGEGKWTRDGNNWTVKLTAVLPDGRSASCTQTIRKLDNDSFMTGMISREIGGEILPNLDEVKVVRSTEDAAAAKETP